MCEFFQGQFGESSSHQDRIHIEIRILNKNYATFYELISNFVQSELKTRMQKPTEDSKLFAWGRQTTPKRVEFRPSPALIDVKYT